MQDDDELGAPVIPEYTPSTLERVESTIVHLAPWTNIIFVGYLGLVLAVLGWSFRRHAAPWTSHACKQVIVWQFLSIPFLLVAVVFIQNWIGAEESLYRLPSVFHPVLGDAVSLWQLVLLPFALVSTYAAIRTAQGRLFRYPFVGDFIRAPRAEDRRSYF